jgi:glycosyltransferase involved in cell wall biosynthesis
MPSAYVVVPVFNERENIQRVLEDVTTFSRTLDGICDRTTTLVVDDGSTDGTSELLGALEGDGRVVLRHPHNSGPGAAFRTAFQYLLDHGLADDDVVVTIEGDATSHPDVMRLMLGRLTEGNDLVLASPYLHGGGFSKVTRDRLFISHVANGLVRLFLGIRGLATFSCFYRAYRGRVIWTLYAKYGDRMIESNGFECAVELLAKAVRCDMAITEVPFRVDWARRKGRSKMRLWPTTLGYLGLFWRLGRQ